MTLSREDKISLLQLYLTKGIGDVAIKRILEACGAKNTSPAAIFHANDTKPDEYGISSELLSEAVKKSGEASELYDTLEDSRVEIITSLDSAYPIRLKAVLEGSAPQILFVRGNKSLLDSELPAVGFCGSRKASPEGINITAMCGSILAKEKISVVSGYASGVDMSAHTSSLKAGGNTIFVLAEGILKFKAKIEIKDYLTAENHIIVSQFPPGMVWASHNAMRRNSTIIGFSDAMVLVESGLEGGTFAAGKETLAKNHPLYVIDYAAPKGSAEANPFFIKQGGNPIRRDKNNNLQPNLAPLMTKVKEQGWKVRLLNQKSLFD